MRVIIAGSRSVTTYASVEAAIALSGFAITELVSGTAQGVDHLGEVWAGLHNIPITRFPADWAQFGKMAGPMRNLEMVKYALQGKGALLAIWDGKSRGTDNIIQIAREYALPRRVVMLDSVEGLSITT